MAYIIALLCFIYASIDEAKFDYCGISTISNDHSTDTSIEHPDTMKVLIVFVKFRDDLSPESAEVDYRKWPLFDDPATLPASAPYLISRSPHPPYADSTLTAYFYQQSGGQFVLFGDVYPRTVVSTKPEAAYHRPAGGYGDLTLDVLRQIDDEGLDFSQYDYEGDGIVDHVFIILRSDTQKDAKRITWTGVSCLDARCGPGVSSGPFRPAPEIDGVEIDWNRSGSIVFNRTPGNVLTHYWLVRIMAHEFGHDVWARHFVHVPAIMDNDVPMRSNFSPPTRTLGYVLMAGAGGGYDARGDETISAFERDLIGWIDCGTPSESRTFRLRDLYMSGDCLIIPTGDERRIRKLYLSNRQRIGPFDRYRRAGVDSQYEVGLLRETGLLASLADRNRMDVLPADNSLELSTSNSTYSGDLFGPRTQPQLTPWTRPNINGYNVYPSGFRPSWHAVDNIRFDPIDNSVILIDYAADFRQAPTIRSDSWFGRESDRIVLEGPVVVTGKTTVTIASSVTVSGTLRLHPGAVLQIAPGGTLLIPPESALLLATGARVSVGGTLSIGGPVSVSAGARMTRSSTGRILHSDAAR